MWYIDHVVNIELQLLLCWLALWVFWFYFSGVETLLTIVIYKKTKKHREWERRLRVLIKYFKWQTREKCAFVQAITVLFSVNNQRENERERDSKNKAKRERRRKVNRTKRYICPQRMSAREWNCITKFTVTFATYIYIYIYNQ